MKSRSWNPAYLLRTALVYAVRFFRKRFRPARTRLAELPAAPPRRILVVGILMADRVNLARTIMEDFARSARHSVDQKWISLFGPCDIDVGGFGAKVSITERDAAPRSLLINELVRPEYLEHYDFIFIVDDDVLLPSGFLDDYIDLVEVFDFAVSQPARTWYSFISHPITRRVRDCIARETLFVEIGPMVCVRRDAFGLLFPVPEASGMGWGLDFVWAHQLSAHDKRRGIIDALPIDHSIRRTGGTYGREAARKAMRTFLGEHPHMSRRESMRTLARHASIQHPHAPASR